MSEDIILKNIIYYIILQRDREPSPVNEFNNILTIYSEGFYTTEDRALQKLLSIIKRFEDINGEKWIRDYKCGYSHNNMHIYICYKILNDENDILSIALKQKPPEPILIEKLLKNPIKPLSKVYVVSLAELPRDLLYESGSNECKLHIMDGLGVVRGVFTQKVKAEKFALKFRKDYGEKGYWIKKDINKWENGEFASIRLTISERIVDEV